MKQLQQQTPITIDGENYVVQLYGPTYGLTLYAKLIRLLGEPIVKMFAVIPKGKSVGSTLDLDISDLNLEVLGEAIEALFLKLSPEDFAPLLKEILSQTLMASSFEPVVDKFESRFAGQYSHLFKLVVKTVGVQYGDFLSGVLKKMNVAKSAALFASTPTPST